MKIFSIAFLLLILIFADKASAMKIYIYNKGVSDQVEFTAAQEKKIMEIAKDIYENADKTLSFNINKENIKDIKSKDRCVEIDFEVTYPFSNGAIGYSVVRKMLIPLSGSYAGDMKNGGLTFFVGQDEYDGKSYSNANGLKYIEEIYKALQR